MNEININEIVKVESIGVIKQQLDKVEKIVDDKIKNIPKVLKQLEQMTDEEKEEKKGEIKKYKTYLNSIKTQLEDKRKEIHNEIEKPYNDFNNYYSNGVKIKLEESINKLSNVINDIENKQKQEKRNELELFAKQHFEVNNIDDIVSFDDIGLNINLTGSVKSLKEQILKFVEQINNDIELIKLEEYSDEILLEYKQNRDFSKSKLDVIERHKQLEEIQKQQEMKQEQEKQEEQVVEKVDEIVAPVEVIEDDELITVSFKVTGTKEQIKKIKELIIELGVSYE